MGRVAIWSLRVVLALLLFAILAIIALWIVSESVIRRAHPLEPETVRAAGPEAVAEGRRLAKLYGCTSCHGPELRGHMFNDEPVLVRNHAPNLTLLSPSYSDAEFAQAIKQGVHPKQRRALWGMPSGTFSTIPDAELGAVLSFLRSIPPGGAASPDERPSLYSRLALVLNHYQASDPTTEMALRPSTEQVATARSPPPRNLGPGHEKGRRIAATICSECHGSDLRGDATEGGPDLVVAAAYDRAAFHRLLRTGVPPGGRDLGIMSEAAREDFKVFTDAELDSLHAYLKARAEAK